MIALRLRCAFVFLAFKIDAIALRMRNDRVMSGVALSLEQLPPPVFSIVTTPLPFRSIISAALSHHHPITQSDEILNQSINFLSPLL
jgi:hypothetical protein